MKRLRYLFLLLALVSLCLVILKAPNEEQLFVASRGTYCGVCNTYSSVFNFRCKKCKTLVTYAKIKCDDNTTIPITDIFQTESDIEEAFKSVEMQEYLIILFFLMLVSFIIFSLL